MGDQDGRISDHGDGPRALFQVGYRAYVILLVYVCVCVVVGADFGDDYFDHVDHIRMCFQNSP